MRGSMSVVILLAPATALAATLRHRDLAPAAGLSGGWAYAGCYVDSVSARVLNSAFKGDDRMSAETCTAFCSSEGYSVAGVEYSSECFCGNALPPQAAHEPSTCNMPCSGKPEQACGGQDRLSVYSSPVIAGPQTNPGPDGWQSLGCYSDSVSARSLSRLGAAGDQMTVAVCAVACAGSEYFGVEYAAECFCGDALENGGTSAADGCVMQCKGNRAELCGGSNRLNLYQVVALATDTFSPSVVPPTISPSSVVVSSLLDTPTPESSSSSSDATSSTPSSSLIVTPSPLTTSSSSSPSTTNPSPSSSPEPGCTSKISTGGQIYNGGFELNSPWIQSSSSNAASSEIWGYAYEGCSSELLRPLSASSTSRFVEISPTTRVSFAPIQLITLYLGRRGSSSSSNKVSTFVTMRIFNSDSFIEKQFPVCSGNSCDLTGTGGTVWRKYEVQIDIEDMQAWRLQIVTSWTGPARQDGSDDVLIDGILFT